MNGQLLTRIQELETEVKTLKSLTKTGTKKPQKKSMLIGIWKGLKVSDKQLKDAKKAPFDFDVEKYVKET